jgi:hypothetical protein
MQDGLDSTEQQFAGLVRLRERVDGRDVILICVASTGEIVNAYVVDENIKKFRRLWRAAGGEWRWPSTA